MHHKLFIVDDAVVVGSYNPSAAANTKNAESFVIIREPDVLSAALAEFESLR